MKKVYKYIIPDNRDYFTLELPYGSDILYVREQGENICLWALVEAKETLTVARVIRLAETGHPLEGNENYTYLGSAHLYGGSLIIHTFEVG